MVVNSASVAVAMVLSLLGTSPSERTVVPRPPAVAPLHLAAAKLWAPKKSKPKSDDDDDADADGSTKKKEDAVLKPRAPTPAPRAPARSSAGSRATAPTPAAAHPRRRIKMDTAVESDDEGDDEEDQGGDDDEDDKPKVTKRRRKVVEEEEEEDEDEEAPILSLPIVRPRLAGLEVGPTLIARSFHYNTPLQGDAHTRFGYQFALEAFPLLRAPIGVFRRIGLGIAYEAESGSAGVIRPDGSTVSYPSSMGHWGFDFRYVLTVGSRLVLVPALGYGRASAGLSLPAAMQQAPSACSTDVAYPCYASTNPSYLSVDLGVRVAATSALSFSLVGGYLLGLSVKSGAGQISSSEATASMQGFHVDVGGSVLVYSDWLAVRAEVPIRQYSYSLAPTMASATYRSATDTSYGLVVGLAALGP